MDFVTGYGLFMGNFAFNRFNHYTSNAMQTQEAILNKIMEDNKDCELGKKYDFASIHSIKDFQDKVPLSTFEDYSPLIDRMVDNDENNIITSKKIVRYCSSSGSVGKPKLQPKTFKDIWSMQCMGFAATPACAANYLKKNALVEKFPNLRGPLLISLNGHKLKNGMQCNGAGQVPFTLTKNILKFYCTTPMDVLYPEDEENTNIPYFQLRFCLPDRKVTFLGSMVITLLSTMFEYLEDNWELVCNDIETGTIDASIKCPESLRKKYGHMKPNPKRANELRAIFREGFESDVPVAKRIWPKLCWGYGMTGSTLAVYVEKLRRYIGDLPMHNMGYAASEGFMAACVELNTNDYVLLPRSLFYEFLPVDAPEDMRPLTLDQIEVGKDYEIIVTNYSGLYRYRILDIVHVTGTYNNSKKIEFLYRSNMGINIANEKTTTQMLDFAAEQLEKKFELNFKGHSFYADTDPQVPKYVLFVETENGELQNIDELVKGLDDALRESNEKYEKYRRWGMIDTPCIYQLKDGSYDDYKASLVAQGRVLNQIKPVTVINTEEKKSFFFSHIAK